MELSTEDMLPLHHEAVILSGKQLTSRYGVYNMRESKQKVDCKENINEHTRMQGFKF
jgi:hypothetical protein